MIAEDEAANALFLQTILARTGIEIFTTENGEIAVDLVRENPDLSIILMDIKMPVMNGLEATSLIRTFNESLPIIACTAYSLNEEREACMIAGCSAFIAKPIRKDEILLKIDEYLNGLSQ